MVRGVTFVACLTFASLVDGAVVNYAFTGSFQSSAAKKEGIFMSGPESVVGRFPYTTENWTITPAGSSKTNYSETLLSQALEIEIEYDGHSYRSSENQGLTNRIQVADDVGGTLRDEFEYLAREQVSPTEQELFLVEFRSSNLDPLESQELPTSFDLGLWDLSAIGRLRLVDEQGNFEGDLVFDIESLTAIPLPSGFFLFGSSLLALFIRAPERLLNQRKQATVKRWRVFQAACRGACCGR